MPLSFGLSFTMLESISVINYININYSLSYCGFVLFKGVFNFNYFIVAIETLSVIFFVV